MATLTACSLIASSSFLHTNNQNLDSVFGVCPSHRLMSLCYAWRTPYLLLYLFSFMGCDLCSGPSSQEHPTFGLLLHCQPFEFLKAILPLNLGFVNKVWWGSGTWTEVGEVHQATMWTCAGSGLGASQGGPGTEQLA